MNKKFISGMTAIALVASVCISPVGQIMAAPTYIYSNESVPTWEKFKEEGGHKAYPEKTTFDISDANTPSLKPLVKDAVSSVYIDKEDLQSKISFNENEKDFFDKIKEVKLLLNNGKEETLSFRKEGLSILFDFPEDVTEPFHEYVPDTGIKVILGYPVKIYSEGFDPKIIPGKISGIDERVFVANTNMFGVARQGEDITFKLYNFNPYVLTTEEKYRDQLFDSITLITPSHQRKLLQMKTEDANTTEVGADGKDHPALKYKDWSLVGNALRLTASEHNFDEPGNYSIEIKFSQREGEKHPIAKGYFTVSKTPGDKVKAPSAEEIKPPNKEIQEPGIINPEDMRENKIDAVSRATGTVAVSSGDGDSSGGGAGGSHALVVYDVDMLTNVWALHLLGYETEESSKIYNRYKFETDQSGKILSDETGEKYYELNRFKESVRMHEARGKYLNFKNYQDFGSLVRDRVSSIFYLLEDGTLGRMTPNHDNVGKIPPEMIWNSYSDYRNPLSLTVSDESYLENLTSLEVNGKTLPPSQYSIQGKKIIIDPSALVRGHNTIIAMSKGYKINEAIYELLPLDAMPGPSPQIVNKALANTGLVLRGFDKYFAEDNEVEIKLTAPGGEPEKLFDKAHSQGITEKTFCFETYEDKFLENPRNGRKLIFSQECFPNPGVYTISIKSKHYGTGTFKVFIGGESKFEQPFASTVATDYTRLIETKPYDFINKQLIKKVTLVKANKSEVQIDKKTFMSEKGWDTNQIQPNAISLYGYFLEPNDYVVIVVENGNQDIQLVYVETEKDGMVKTKPEGFGKNPDPKEKNAEIDFSNSITTGKWTNDHLIFKPDGMLNVKFVRPKNEKDEANNDGSMDIYLFNYDENNPLTKVYWKNPEMEKGYLRVDSGAVRVGEEQPDGETFYRALHLMNPDFTEKNRYPGLDGNLKPGVKIILEFKNGDKFAYEIPEFLDKTQQG